ncbi:MAG: GTPase Era [Bacteroidota bacterium]|nr:GTPase Era [Bacteroidota bacterium]
MNHKSGFVNIIGNPNVGKSTLINSFLGQKLSIITHKAQTTRHRILGVLNDDNYQIVFSDTPGIITPKYELQESMMNFVSSIFEDADILIYMIDASSENYSNDDKIIEKLKSSKLPLLVLLNKIDLSNQDLVTQKMADISISFPTAKLFAISALNNFNLDILKEKIIELLPVAPAYFSKDTLTDKSERFFVEEIIREKILTHYKNEIPYSVEIEVEEFIEKSDFVRIRAIIYVMRNSQKGIIIGHKGLGLKRIGSESRRDIEKMLGKKIFLETPVKVKKNWRNDKKQLKNFGY